VSAFTVDFLGQWGIPTLPRGLPPDPVPLLLRPQPCAVLRIDFGKEQVEATVVELAVKIRQVPVCLREVVAVELTEVLQNGAVRAVDGDQLDRPRRWMGWERGSGHGRSVALCKESPKCCVPIRVSSRQFAGGALMCCAHRRRSTRSIQRGHCPISRTPTGDGFTLLWDVDDQDHAIVV